MWISLSASLACSVQRVETLYEEAFYFGRRWIDSFLPYSDGRITAVGAYKAGIYTLSDPLRSLSDFILCLYSARI